MTYRVEFGGGAQAQFHTLPEHRRDALVERAVELSEQLWDAVIRPPGTDTRFRGDHFRLRRRHHRGHGLGRLAARALLSRSLLPVGPVVAGVAELTGALAGRLGGATVASLEVQPVGTDQV